MYRNAKSNRRWNKGGYRVGRNASAARPPQCSRLWPLQSYTTMERLANDCANRLIAHSHSHFPHFLTDVYSHLRLLFIVMSCKSVHTSEAPTHVGICQVLYLHVCKLNMSNVLRSVRIYTCTRRVVAVVENCTCQLSANITLMRYLRCCYPQIAHCG